MKVLQRCGNVMGTSQLLLHQDIVFATSPVHHFVPKTGCLAGLVLRPSRNDPLLEAIVEPVDNNEVIGRIFAARPDGPYLDNVRVRAGGERVGLPREVDHSANERFLVEAFNIKRLGNARIEYVCARRGQKALDEKTKTAQ